MFKLLLLILGLAGGTAGTASWLLSGTGPAPVPELPLDGDSWEARLNNLKVRFREAMAEGARAEQYTQEHLQRRLDAYRKGAGRTA